MSTATTELVHAIAHRRLDEIPDDLVHESKRLLLDFLGVGLAGARSESGRIAAEVAAQLGGAPESVLLGHSARVNSVNAAYANAIAAHSIELDDIDVEALFHYAPPVVAASLAAAQAAGSS